MSRNIGLNIYCLVVIAMTQFSAWSESESGVTMEIGLALGGEDAAADCGHSDASRLPERCVIPKVQPALNRSDQRVPVYRDQTVPEWPSCKQAALAKFKGKSAHTSSGVSYGECYHTVYHRSSPRILASSRGYEEEHNGDYGRWSDNATRISSEVSFEDIMSMYQSSLM